MLSRTLGPESGTLVRRCQHRQLPHQRQRQHHNQLRSRRWDYNSLGPGMTINKSTISDNTASGSGGGTSCVERADVIDSVIEGNTASLDGGGVYGSGETITRSVIEGNTAGLSGGGVYVSFQATFTDSTVTNNTATTGGGVFAANVANVTLNGTNNLCGNTPDDWPTSPLASSQREGASELGGPASRAFRHRDTAERLIPQGCGSTPRCCSVRAATDGDMSPAVIWSRHAHRGRVAGGAGCHGESRSGTAFS